MFKIKFIHYLHSYSKKKKSSWLFTWPNESNSIPKLHNNSPWYQMLRVAICKFQYKCSVGKSHPTPFSLNRQFLSFCQSYGYLEPKLEGAFLRGLCQKMGDDGGLRLSPTEGDRNSEEDAVELFFSMASTTSEITKVNFATFSILCPWANIKTVTTEVWWSMRFETTLFLVAGQTTTSFMAAGKGWGRRQNEATRHWRELSRRKHQHYLWRTEDQGPDRGCVMA